MKINIQYDVLKENDMIYVHSNITRQEYNIFVEDALCIEQQGDSPIPILLYRILKDSELRRNVLKEKGRACCHVLKRDQKKVEKYLWQ